MTFKLKPLFTKIGQLFQRELMLNINKQKDLNNSTFSPIKPSTAWGRVTAKNKKRVEKEKKKFKRGKFGRRSPLSAEATEKLFKGKGKFLQYPSGISTKRLWFTHKFWKNAFKHRAQDESVEVFVNPDWYPVRMGESIVNYTDIVHYNNQGSSQVNKYIKNPPLIFPNTEIDVRKMDAYKQAEELIKDSFQRGEILKQIEEHGLKNMVTELHIYL